MPVARPSFTNIPITLSLAGITSVKWSEDESRVLVVSADGAEVFSPTENERAPICKLSNGSGGLGQLSSVNFLPGDLLLSIWEFGRARLWSLVSGQSDDLQDFKTTCDGGAWRMRPRTHDQQPDLLAFLSRTGSDDYLTLFVPSQMKYLSSVKLATIDAQTLSWSPDGSWLVVQDTAAASPSLHVFTPDGHPFRTYPSTKAQATGLGVKSTTWSPDAHLLAVANFDGRIELLSSRTFSVITTLEHTQTINQSSLSLDQQATIWQENISAAGSHSYTSTAQPASPPLSQSRPSPDQNDIGVIEQKLSSDSGLLATRDHRMQNTIWLWNTTTLSLHTVILQHQNIRRLLWHPTRHNLLLVDSGEGILHLFDTASLSSPQILRTGLRPRATVSWVVTPVDTPAIILVAEKQCFRLLYPEGQPEGPSENRNSARATAPGAFGAEDNGDDSLFDILSSRKPLPPKSEPSYTERLDLEMEAEDTIGVVLEDTFREKRKGTTEPEFDPLDDSDIF